ncbi:centrosomal AT-AC splicing factor isoform X1 [Apteryx mantelli]|uniref:Centrosomal AT-AC splicing factor isoform X1 n=1 Tax=Apteryx mantelli TaxID=2696672 RepID=A0ABM4FN45_9AVES
MAPHYCGLCRRTSFAGRRHLYSAAHRQRLREALGRLQAKVEAARAAIGSAAVRRYEAAEPERRVWCLCCGRDVPRDGRRGGLALPHAALLQHLAGPEHRRETARFWRENRAEAALRQRFVVSAEDYGRFTESLARALAAYEEREDECIREMAARIREAERRRQETVQAALEPPTEPQLCAGPSVYSSTVGQERDIFHDAEQPGPSGMQEVPDLNWMEPGQALTFIGHQETEGKGNIHTGARPPWLIKEEEEVGSQQQIGPSYEEFLKEKEKQKLRKLPADRVGANFDHTSQTGDSWLPSFGRVWNHGRRWQSRHQFRAESGEKKKKR